MVTLPVFLILGYASLSLLRCFGLPLSAYVVELPLFFRLLVRCQRFSLLSNQPRVRRAGDHHHLVGLRCSIFTIAFKVVIGRGSFPVGMVCFNGALNNTTRVILSRRSCGQQHEEKYQPFDLAGDRPEKSHDMSNHLLPPHAVQRQDCRPAVYCPHTLSSWRSGKLIRPVCRSWPLRRAALRTVHGCCLVVTEYPVIHRPIEELIQHVV